MGREQLAARRRELGLSQEQLAQELHVATGTYARWERSEATPLVGFRPRLAERLRVSLAELDYWLNESSVGAVEVARLRAQMSVYVSMEQSASKLDAYEPHYFHGLLQTSDYAHALAQESAYRTDDSEEAKRYVEQRMNRQAALTRTQDPLALSVIVSESALVTQVGDAAIMRTQIEHVIHMLERPNINVNILPFTSGPHAATRGAFAFMSFPWGPTPGVVYLESYIGGASYIDAPYEIERFSILYERLNRRALPHKESIDLLRRRAKEQTI
jgi:transcriptional regulator with XRE-family HTH domain